MSYENELYNRDKSDEPMFQHMQDTLFRTVSNLLELEEGNDLLDVGCGLGEFIQYSNPANYYGIDASVPNIKKAKERFGKKEFKVMDITDVKLNDNAFDKVSCIEVLEHLTIEKMHQTLKEMVRVTVPGGTIIITVPNLYYLWAFVPWNFRPIKRRMTLGKLMEGMKKGYVEERYHQRHYRFKPEFIKKILEKYSVVEGYTTSFWYNNRTIHNFLPNLQKKIHKLSWKGNHKLGNNIIFKLRNNKGMAL